MITQEESKQINRLLNIYRWEQQDLNELQDVVRKHIDGGYTVCSYCSAQLKHIIKRLKEWYMVQQVEDNEPIEPLVEANIEIEVDEVEADKVGCTKCKRKAKTKK